VLTFSGWLSRLCEIQADTGYVNYVVYSEISQVMPLLTARSFRPLTMVTDDHTSRSAVQTNRKGRGWILHARYTMMRRYMWLRVGESRWQVSPHDSERSQRTGSGIDIAVVKSRQRRCYELSEALRHVQSRMHAGARADTIYDCMHAAAIPDAKMAICMRSLGSLLTSTVLCQNRLAQRESSSRFMHSLLLPMQQKIL
jgi:hypothetical protein